MKRNLGYITVILIVLIQFSAEAQKSDLGSLLSIELKATGVVEQQNKVKGYYSFYRIETADKDNSIYMVKLFDENAREIISERFKDANQMMMIAAAFDDETILMKFLIRIDGENISKYYIYNQAKEFKPITRPTSNNDDGRYSLNINGPETLSRSLFASSKNGFFNYAPYIVDKAHGYEIFHLDSDGNKKWAIQSQVKLGERSVAKILLSTNKNLYSVISNYEETSRYLARKGNDIVQYINCIDIETGKKRFETKLEDAKYRYQVFSGQGSELNNNISIYGLYFPKDAEMDKYSPLGIFTATINTNGLFTEVKRLVFDMGIDKYFHSANYKSISAIGKIYFHNVFQTADKKIYAIAENFKVAYGNDIVVFTTNDLFIFECTPDFKLASIKDFQIPSVQMSMYNEGEMSEIKTANRAREQGLFGYLFTQLSPDGSSFVIGYGNFPDERKIKILPERIITSANYGAIIYKDGKYQTDKINLKVDKDIFRPLNAKYGHILVSGYIKDEKKQELRLEKVNF